MMEEIKYAVQAVILNEKGEVLSVSRKDDHNDFGLAGGKVDPEDATLFDALKREVMEETGLTIHEEDSTQIFSMHRDGYMGYTYLIQNFEGEIETDEPHVVKWLPFHQITLGSFGFWNTMVYYSLISLGISVKYNEND